MVHNKEILKVICVLAWPPSLNGIEHGVQYVDTTMVGRVVCASCSRIDRFAVWLMVGSFAAIGIGVLSCIAKAIGAKGYESRSYNL